MKFKNKFVRELSKKFDKNIRQKDIENFTHSFLYKKYYAN